MFFLNKRICGPPKANFHTFLDVPVWARLLPAAWLCAMADKMQCIQIVHCSPQSRRFFGHVNISFWPRVANMFQTLLLHWLLLGDGAHGGCGGRLQLQRLWRCDRLQLLCHAAVAAVALVAWLWKDLETKKTTTPYTIRSNLLMMPRA